MKPWQRAHRVPSVSLASTGASPQSAPNTSELGAWRTGTQGMPAQLFIGFLPAVTKRDAVQYAIGVAERNAVSLANAAYFVVPWRGGWAYEVHEGGPKRAYLPRILRFFDEQGEHAPLDDLVAQISTAGRAVRVEKTQAGLTAFLMPESFEGAQSAWLEPGAPLIPAVRSRKGVLVAGILIFASGCVVLTMALALRDPPAQENERVLSQTRFEDLPIKQWPAVLAAASSGYVESLEYSSGQWRIQRAQASEPGSEP